MVQAENYLNTIDLTEDQANQIIAIVDEAKAYVKQYQITSFEGLSRTHKAVSYTHLIAANPDAKWKIVVFHHSVYSVASHAFDSDILARRDQLVPVFSELGIDAVLMGHDHVYTRSYMMNGTTPDVQRNEDGSALSSVTNPSGTLYLTANSASGSKFYTMKNSEFPFAAVQNQERVPNITKIEMTDTSMRIDVYKRQVL